MRIRIESHCDEAMGKCEIIDFVTDIFKAAEGKSRVLYPLPYRKVMSDSDSLRIVINIGRILPACDARIEDDKGIIGTWFSGKGFARSARHEAYILE